MAASTGASSSTNLTNISACWIYGIVSLKQVLQRKMVRNFYDCYPRAPAQLSSPHRQGQAPYTPGGDRPLKEGQSRRPEGPPEAHREELKAGGLGGQEVPRDGPSLRGPYPGGQHRAYEGGREVRS